MGSVTALLHGDRDPSIAGMVLDSPFSNLPSLCKEIAKSKAKVPSFILSTAIKFLRRTVRKEARFDINDLAPIKHVGQCFIPALFGAARGDDFILPHHTEELHAAYAGDKQLVMFEGDHNSPRPEVFHEQITSFFISVLQCESVPMPMRQVSHESEMTEEEQIRLAIEASLRESN
jgi:pimeloyl-ACP methyl ester carboxylesterase